MQDQLLFFREGVFHYPTVQGRNNTRILRRALSKGKAYEGKNRHFEAKRGHLSRFSVIFQEKTAFL